MSNHNKTLHIIGAGGYALCIADAAISSSIFEDIIFYDLEPKIKLLIGFPVLEESAIFEIENASSVNVGIGDNSKRQMIVDLISKKRTDFIYPVIQHKNASVSKFAEIGDGSVLLNGVVVGPCAKIGKHASLYSNSVLEHEAEIGDYVTLAPAAATGGNVILGERTFLGLGATVNHGIKIGSDVIIGAGSVVTQHFDSNCVLVGAPARKIKDRKKGDIYL